MIIATSVTSDYFRKSLPFFDSVNKHFGGKKICFCIDFHAEFEGWEMIYVDSKTINCQWQPTNRENYYSLQHGEFVKYYPFEVKDLIAFVDSDMILQRDFKTKMEEWDSNFLVTNSSFPPTLLSDAVVNISDDENQVGRFFKNYTITNEKEFCAAFIIGSTNSWSRLYHDVLVSYKDFLSHFNHHAAWQLLINYVIIKHHNYKVIPPLIQNAEWYNCPDTKVVDDVLMWKDEVVYFNHTKFNRTFKY